MENNTSPAAVGNNCRVCPKYRGMCQDEHGMRFVSCQGDLNRCTECGGKSITIEEWVSEYLEYQTTFKKCRPGTVKRGMSHLRTFMRYTKLSYKDRVSAISKDMIRLFWTVSEPDLKAVTRKMIISLLYSMSGEDFRDHLSSKGKVLSKLPRVNGLNGSYDRYVPLSENSRRALGDLRFRYRNLEDPRKWMALTLGLCHGMSKADVLRATWDIFKAAGHRTIVSYNRNKTGKLAEWVVSDDDLREWARVKEIMIHTKKFCARFNIRGTENSIFRLPAVKTDDNLDSALIREINNDLRAVIPEWKTNPKAFHNLRKEFANYVCRTYDWETAEFATGDTAATLRKSYVGKKTVDWDNMSGMKI